ncbi:MAG: tRNA threonylcarbamoyladenosine dehydratase [Oscillospiraceae bacterium]|nr:tRNA threonylcarbamoyladenosine dehydratase [Oscillospiraceae bacterium]
MNGAFVRSEMLFGAQAMERLRRARVAVFGLGGVGGAAAEALARSGIGTLDLVDHDRVSLSNLNRQLIATADTLELWKADAAAARVRSINPEAVVHVHRCFFGPDTAEQFDFAQYDYVADAIDTVTGKLAIIARAKAANVPVISAMGAGNKLDPTAFRVADISQTSVCPLARVMRKELKRRNIQGVKVVYSTEMPHPLLNHAQEPGSDPRKVTPGSCSFVPPVAGFILAGQIVKDLLGIDG